ncbi:DICT sensory domain-containing protein [Goekera deserti]|uniref:DICT domain-containing protein n=1 Tax=Goekera deserti TaxID=2497753 RepID=A0A7K3WHW9_9ACTN|nr:DICT sensory domain-containing protein [Goekera deserti]NDI48476.1 hypothetical protein [Goekera deserti]NEL56078.1 hypothetical protein [Goekera deserti]
MPPTTDHAPAVPAARTSPFDLAVSGDCPVPLLRSKPDLLALSRAAEERPLSGQPGDVVLVGVQDARFWTPRTQAAYQGIAALGPVVVAFGVGLPTELSAPLSRRVMTVGIDADDPLADEWLVLFYDRQSRWGFVAKDAAAGVPGARRVAAHARDAVRFDRARTFLYGEVADPEALGRAATELLDRVPDLDLTVPWLAR